MTILDLDPLFTSLYHNGGAMAFGPDGKLCIGVGENVMPQLSQDMTSRFGKMLRINADGSIPTDNRGATDVLDAALDGSTSLLVSLAGVPPGTYYVRVAAVSACGVGAPSNQVSLTVP